MKTQLSHTFEDIISIENLLDAWREFIKGKRKKQDVQEFQMSLMDNILALHRDLANRTYCHGGYHAFNISDPKPRIIHKATVRDRLLHHALYRKMYPFFDRVFIADSYSCRVEKGTHRAINRFRAFGRMVSKNNTRTCWVLKCDIRKFFTSIDQDVLLRILRQYIPDNDMIWLLERVIRSFESTAPDKGLPLGNLTSQLFANVYMNEFDQFVKHRFKMRYYVRYADDFVFLSHDRGRLETALPIIDDFLREKLKLSLHPDKVFIKTFASGVDFLGWIHFPDHRVLRTSTKRRMIRRVVATQKQETIDSYLGLLRHGNAHGLQERIAEVDTESLLFSL
ncbi:MAG: reverse transcriptase/maturase family protein [Candidatus Sungiibacteriota bacterium]